MERGTVDRVRRLELFERVTFTSFHLEALLSIKHESPDSSGLDNFPVTPFYRYIAELTRSFQHKFQGVKRKLQNIRQRLSYNPRLGNIHFKFREGAGNGNRHGEGSELGCFQTIIDPIRYSINAPLSASGQRRSPQHKISINEASVFSDPGGRSAVENDSIESFALPG